MKNIVIAIFVSIFAVVFAHWWVEIMEFDYIYAAMIPSVSTYFGTRLFRPFY